jgi:hypothetical protein
LRISMADMTVRAPVGAAPQCVRIGTGTGLYKNERRIAGRKNG